MTQFNEDDMRVIRAMQEAREQAGEEERRHDLWVSAEYVAAAQQYAGLKAFFDNVQIDATAMATSSAKVLTPAPRSDQ